MSLWSMFLVDDIAPFLIDGIAPPLALKSQESDTSNEYDKETKNTWQKIVKQKQAFTTN